MKSDIKVIHSFWTAPLSLSCYGVDRLHRLMADVRMFALSMAWIRELGLEIELHTDSLGAKLLSDLPYSDIKLSLDDMPAGIHPRFWAAGKIVALRKANASVSPQTAVVHIDGDVIIRNPDLLSPALSSGVFVQQYEHHDQSIFTREGGRIFGQTFLNILEAASIDTTTGDMLNCGVICINSDDVLRRWCTRYTKIAVEMSRRFSEALTHKSSLTLDLFAEQLNLLQTAREYDASISMVIKPGEPVPPGYHHLLTARKYSDRVSGAIDRALKERFPDIHSKISKLCRNI